MEMSTKRFFGHIPGVNVGDEFLNRQALASARVHCPTQAGISGSAKEGADSIVLSGGYEDDVDEGTEIIYTGAGGRDEKTGLQNADQELTRVNLALAKNTLLGLPVRVIRGHQHKSPYSPKQGYKYCGLYAVSDYWKETGKSGFLVWRYRLEAIASDEDLPNFEVNESDTQSQPVTRRASTVLRIIRDTQLSKQVKSIHQYCCQVCGIQITGSAGPYAEGAHIKPLGAPHYGPDTLSNLLCLCPNHHVMFDYGAFSINDDLSLIGIAGSLRVNTEHKIDLEYVRYHREHYYCGQSKP